MTKAGKRLIEAANEALQIARGERPAAQVHERADVDVKAIRARTGLSQEEFAFEFGFTLNQIRDWEQHRSRPLGGVRAYLMLIRQNPDTVWDLLKETRSAE